MLNIDVPYKQLSKVEGMECFSKYYIDINGNVYSVKNPKNIKILKPCWSRKKKTPFLVVMLSGDNGERKTFYVHHLVAHSFLPPGFRGKFISHKDDDQSNNSLDNIYYTDNIYRIGKRGKDKQQRKAGSGGKGGRPKKPPKKVFTFGDEVMKEIELVHQAALLKGVYNKDKFEFLDDLVRELIDDYCGRKGLKKILYQLKN